MSSVKREERQHRVIPFSQGLEWPRDKYFKREKIDKLHCACLGHSVRCLKPCVFPCGFITLFLISQCSVSCGEGVARRLVTCRIGDQCTGEKPESHRLCRPGPCHGKMALTTTNSGTESMEMVSTGNTSAQGQKSALIKWFYGVLTG